MAALNNTFPTLLDMVKRTDPNGAIATIVETLTQRNTLLQDAVFQEGNLLTGHRFTSRTALPGIAWRRMNEGVAPSKSRTGQVDESCGMLEGNSVVDCAEAELGGNEAAFRASEDMAFVQAFSNELETGMFYHSTKSAPEKFMGLSPRFDATTNPGGNQIIKADTSASGSDQTSIWLVQWGPETVFGLYPKGGKGGLVAEDMGKQMWDDGTGKKFRAYVTNWRWQVGLCVKDWRSVCRIANVDVGNLLATGQLITQAMIKAVHRVYRVGMGRPIFYCNRDVATYLHLQAQNATTNSTLKIENIGGQPITTMLGIPVRETDAILSTEAVVS